MAQIPQTNQPIIKINQSFMHTKPTNQPTEHTLILLEKIIAHHLVRTNNK